MARSDPATDTKAIPVGLGSMTFLLRFDTT
jgi:hypothetical protein